MARRRYKREEKTRLKALKSRKTTETDKTKGKKELIYVEEQLVSRD